MTEEREILFQKLLTRPIINHEKLRILSREGVPSSLRPIVYKILLLVFGNSSSLNIWAENELIRVYDRFFTTDTEYCKSHKIKDEPDLRFKELLREFERYHCIVNGIGQIKSNKEINENKMQVEKIVYRSSIMNILEILRRYYRYFMGLYNNESIEANEIDGWVLVDRIDCENTIIDKSSDGITADSRITDDKSSDNSNDNSNSNGENGQNNIEITIDEDVKTILDEMITHIENEIDEKIKLNISMSTMFEPIEETMKIFTHLTNQNEKRRLKYMPSEDDILMMEKDIQRINPQYRYFNGVDFAYLYRNIIQIVCYQRPTMGYFQGMTDLMAPFVYLFLNNDPVNAEPMIYCCFTKLLSQMETDILTNCKLQFERVIHLLSIFDKDLYSLFNRNDFDNNLYSFAFNWMHCLFIRQLNIDEWFRMFDYAVTMNISEFTVFFTVSMMIKMRDLFLRNDISEIMDALKKIKGSITAEILIEMLMRVDKMRTEYFK